jgi:hypothetical protein
MGRVDETRPPAVPQEPTAVTIKAVGALRAGLSSVGLHELAAKLSDPFWSMRRDDQGVLLGELAAELRRVPVTSQPAGHASARTVSSYVREPVSFHYFFELEGDISADRRLLEGFADADRWLVNDYMAGAPQWLRSAAEDVLRMPRESFDCQGPTSWADGTQSEESNTGSNQG